MSAQLQPRWLSVADHLAFEERSVIKHEYLNGEIYAMARASTRHHRITLGGIFVQPLGDSHAELTRPCAGLTVRLAELYEGTGLLEPSPDAEGPL